MNTNVLYIKNMVCDRCIKVVGQLLEELNISFLHIELGKVILSYPTQIDIEELSKILKEEGFELIDDESTRIINQIKTLIIRLIREADEKENQNLSSYLEKELNKSYSSLSSLFSTVEGRTIEKYAIQQRIEFIKELLVYGEKTISEIAWQLGYSSAQYLSNQFKAETGLSPSEFRKTIGSTRKPLDKV